MTILKIYKLSDNENPQAIISISEKGGELKSININPCFYKAANKKNIEIIPRNRRKKLNDGDSFALLADSFWFKVQLNSDGLGLNTTSMKKKQTVSATTSKQSKLQPSEDSTVTGDVFSETEQSHMQDLDKDADMKIDIVKEIRPVTKHKINPSGKKFRSFQEVVTSGEKRNFSNLTSENCKKLKSESQSDLPDLPVDKPVVDTKKLLENIRQIVIEDYPEATLLGGDSTKNTAPKERKCLKTSKLAGKNIKISPSTTNSKKSSTLLLHSTNRCTVSPTEGKANNNSDNAFKDEKVPSADTKSHKENNSGDNHSKESFGLKNDCKQQETENIRKLANIAFESLADQSNMCRELTNHPV
nr:unnamed protein product [Callosobruchus chinensis]